MIYNESFVLRRIIMQFSFRMPVAVQILLCIAKFDGVFKTTSTFLASSVNINPVIIRKTLGQLKAAGLVEVAAGVGGARLVKEPCEITLQEIFNAVEEDEDLFHIQENPNPQCPVGRNIQQVLGNKLSVVKNHMLDDFAKITLADLLNDINTAEESRQ
jgi:Rrf2 family protein